MATAEQRVDGQDKSSRHGEKTPPEDTEDRHGAQAHLAELIDLHERTAWRDVGTISTAEAAAWTARLIEARDDLREGDR